MKIKKLWISEYKNIKDLTFDFESNLISLLVGRNGLGKSNLIEILALIFRDLDLLVFKSDFADWAYEHFEYKIQFECKNSELKIRCQSEIFEVSRRQKGTKEDFENLTFGEFQKRKKAEFLPDFIIGYYSGENKRIREIIRLYEDSIWDQLKSNEGLDSEFRPMFFAENHHSLLILLTVLLFRFQPPSEAFGIRLNRLIDEFTSFSTLDSFSIQFRNPSWYRRTPEKPGPLSIENLEANLLAKKPEPFPFWGAKGKAHKMFSFLFNNSRDQATYYYDNDEKREYLYLTFDRDTVAPRVTSEFGHPSAFMDALDALYVIESIEEIKLRVRSEKRNIDFDFTTLSEGEQQLISVLGLVLITGRKDCLFLLDEPDTHLNPHWQRRYVQLLQDFNLNDDNSHMIVSTHSPLLVQESKDCDLFLFKEGTGNIVKVDSKVLKYPNWRIDHVLLSKYFNLESARPTEIEPWVQKRKEIIARGELTDVDKEELQELEGKIGYNPTGETIQELESMLFINQMANQLRNDSN